MKTRILSALLSLIVLAAFTSAHAQTNVTLNGTSGTNSITNNYSTDGGLNLSLGFFADYLVVGGGGGGGGSGTDTTAWGGGGGGAGGLLQGNTQLSASNYSVIVGAGGAGGPRSGSASAQQGTNGSNSVFGSLTAIGGGGGGAYKIQGNSGGSGGGGGGRGTGNDLRTPGGAGTTNGSIVQGFAGGASRDDDSSGRVAGGGGGGASAVGGTGGTNTSVAGDGGAGLTNSITGSAVVYAGGGGGGAFDTFVSDERAGTGGAGGGGAGSITGNASNGTNGLGGGGGGVGSQGVGGSGGSGVVIVRYQGASLGSIGGTVTSGTGTATGYTIHTFTNTGSTNLNMSGVDLNNRLGATLNGAITGNGNLSFAGPGTLTLGASNSYSGTTSLTNGALRLANAGTLGTGAVTNNSSLILDRSDALAVANDITGSGSLVQQGAGTSTLTGNNTYGGATTINAGTLQIGNGGTTGTLGAGAVTVASNNASLAINRSDNLDFDKAVAGNGSLVQAGSGTLTILGANVNSGGTVVSAGTMRVGNGGTTGSLGGGNIAISNAATLIYDRSDAVTLGTSLSGAGVLRQSGSGTLTITGNSTHSGGTVIDSGRTLQIGAGSTSGTVGSGAVTNNGTLIYNRSGFTTLANNISGTGSLDVTTTASFTTLSGSNTYSGATRIRGTEITIGQNALAGSTLTTFTNDRTTTLEVKATGGASAYNIGGLAGTRGVYLGSGLASVNVGGNNESTSLSGTLQAVGTGGLNKVGSGTLSLSGVGNSFTKGINIRSGAIEFAAGGDSTAFDVLRVGQNNGDNGALLLSGGRLDAAILVGGGAGSTGTMTVTGGTNNFGFLGLHVGREGTGTLNLSGGTMTGNFASVAYTDGSTGTLNVTGGTLNASGNFQVGRGTGSTSTINLSGGQIIAGGDARFGIGVSNTTVFNISGGSFAHSGPVGLFINAYGGSNSQVTINLTDTGVLSTTRGIEYLTLSTNSSATINIGTGGAAGTLTAPTIGLAGPNSALNFNHTNSAYTLGAGILGSKLVLSHNGPGTTILTSSGFLDWKGGTVINNGTLQVGNGGSHSSLWAVHAITNNSVLVLNASNLTSMVGVMSGTGSLVKNGSGTLLLYADNTFSGGTTVNSGTLATAILGGTNVGRLLSGSALTVNTNGTFSLGVAQTLGSLSGAGAVLLGTNRLTVGADNSEFSGRMSGAGGLTKAGVGTFTLSGSNSFKGDTLVNDGRLILGSTTALGNASVVKVNSGGTLEATERVVVGYLDLNGGTIIGSNNLVSALTLINSGSVSGLANGTNYSAGILKRTVGVATVDGANSYTGTTRIEAGTVQLVEGGSFAAGSSVFLQSGGTMDLNGISQTFSALDGTGGMVSLGSGNLTVDGGVNSQFGGVIDGAGALVKSGTGTVTLLGANIYNGGTTVNAGRLIGNTTSLQGTITNFATVEFNQESNATLGASITGNGGVVKSGSGTMTVAGAQAYTGTTTVQAGDLKVNGSLAGGVDVQTSASLSGSGSVGAISGAGEINPGNSPGILTATSLNPSGGMTFNFEFTSLNPTFSSSTASVNDLLRLTDTTPFTASLTAANTVNIYFNVGAFGPEQTYTGAFFTDEQSDFLAQISNATFNYYVANTNGAIQYNGVSYTLVDESLDITLSTVNANGADFAGGTVNGQITQFGVVPEPSTYALLTLAAAGFAAHTLRRRRR